MGDIMKHDKIINIAIGKSRKELNYVNLTLIITLYKHIHSCKYFLIKYINNRFVP